MAKRIDTRQISFDFTPPVPAPTAGLVYGHFVRSALSHTGVIETLYHLSELEDGKQHSYAGAVLERPGGIMEIVVHKGTIIYSPTHSSTNHQRIRLGTVSYAEAEKRLAAEARAARVDPHLIWSIKCTAESVRNAKANGWWKAAA